MRARVRECIIYLYWGNYVLRTTLSSRTDVRDPVITRAKRQRDFSPARLEMTIRGGDVPDRRTLRRKNKK